MDITIIIPIILSQKNVWDYVEFQILCEVAGLPTVPMGQWLFMVGTTMAATYRWPGINPEEAVKNLHIELQSK